MTTRAPAQCLACVRLIGPDTGRELPPVERCTAYPRGIPQDIALGADHREPRGDETLGLTFELADDAVAEVRFEWWRSTFAPTDAELAERRIAMTQPVVFEKPPDAMI